MQLMIAGEAKMVATLAACLCQLIMVDGKDTFVKCMNNAITNL